MIYYLHTDVSIVLITLYSKTEQQDVQPQEIFAILQEDANVGPAQDNRPESS